MFKLSTDFQDILSHILKNTHEYLDKSPDVKSLVVGISGGIDSALASALGYMISEDRRDIKLVGRSISIVSNKPGEITRAFNVGKIFCDDFKDINHGRLFNHVYTGIRNSPPISLSGEITVKEKIERGNMKARIRMLHLYDLAHREDGIVLSTDNMTELLLGFWTLHGDVGDFGMIQSLFKTEVYGLALYLARKFERSYMNRQAADAIRNCVAADPTDGLGITDTDLDQILPGWREKYNGDSVFGYGVVDKILIDHLNFGKDQDSPVVGRYKSTHYKRENPFNISREQLLPKQLHEVE